MESSLNRKISRRMRTSESSLHELDDDNLKESRLSKKFSELITKRVIIIVLFLILIVPFFFAEYYLEY